MKNRKIWGMALCCMAVFWSSVAFASEWAPDGGMPPDHVPEYEPPVEKPYMEDSYAEDPYAEDFYAAGSPAGEAQEEVTTDSVQTSTSGSGETLVGVSPATEFQTETENEYESGNPILEGYEILGKEAAESDFVLFDDTQLPEVMYLDVPEVWQNPELPTGCESVALTMALMFEGFELEKTTIAREYLLYNQEDDNMAVGYIGDPFSEAGAGCFAPALAVTAMKYLEDMDSAYSVYDITGSSLDEVLAYVAIGRPVIIWGSMYMMEPQFTGDVTYFGGLDYHWYGTEHCMVLSGYNLTNGTVVVNDPLEGIVTRDLDEFERIFDLTGQNAMVLKKEV